MVLADGFRDQPYLRHRCAVGLVGDDAVARRHLVAHLLAAGALKRSERGSRRSTCARLSRARPSSAWTASILQRPVQFRAPLRGIGARLRTDRIDLPQILGLFVAVRLHPVDEVAPGAGQPLIRPVIDSARHLRRRKRRPASRDPRLSRDRQPRRRVRNRTCPAAFVRVMREHRADRLHALFGERCHQLLDGWPECVPHLAARNGEADHGGLVRVRLNDFWMYRSWSSKRFPAGAWVGGRKRDKSIVRFASRGIRRGGRRSAATPTLHRRFQHRVARILQLVHHRNVERGLAALLATASVSPAALLPGYQAWSKASVATMRSGGAISL